MTVNITTVVGKGAPLSATEFDANFTNLKTAVESAQTEVSSIVQDIDSKLGKEEQAADSAKLQGKAIGTNPGDVLTQGATHIVNSTSENLACAVSSVARSGAASGFFGFKAQYSVASNTIFKLSGTRYSGSQYVPFEVKITFYTGSDGVGQIGICESSDLNLPVVFYYKHSTREIIIGVNQNSTYRNFNMSISYISWRARCFFENITEVPADFSLYTISYRQIVYNDTVDVLANKKISFQNTNDAAANILDWYEEGSFTPGIYGSNSSGSGTYSAQSGFYQRIGNRVHFQLHIVWSAHTGTGTIRVSGLPFTPNNIASVPCNFLAQNVAFAGTIKGAVGATLPVIVVYTEQSGGNWDEVLMSGFGELRISGSYRV
ncbi:MAG: hypothetical protein LRY50_09985 [Geovibrio sp.]|nr:hypothetical protein [Geovibrio sp.]